MNQQENTRSRVRMIHSVIQLGTDFQLTEGNVYQSEVATNQPDFEAKGLVFVFDESGQSCLCTLGDECIDIDQRLEYLRSEIYNESISYGEIVELQSLSEFINPGDVLLLQWAGVEEFSK